MIITFYSYKGGVGRTQLAANLAAYLLYHKNRKILLIDWDLEAPGIDTFFQFDRDKIEYGLIDLFNDFVKKVRTNDKLKQEELPKISNSHIVSLAENGLGRIDLLPASKYNDEYSDKINDFNWFEFYETCNGKYFIEYLKESLQQPDKYKLKIAKYDYIFIDSRTGVSDYSGICNIQFPDMNIVVTAPTQQNFQGCLRVLNSIIESPYVKNEHRSPIIMPILSRIIEGDNTESGIWTAKFRKAFNKHIESFIHYSTNETKIDKDVLSKVINEYIGKTCLPHKNELVYGENLVFDKTRKKPEIGQIQVQYIEIARFIEDLSGINRNSVIQTHQGSGDNVAGDKIILESSRRIPRNLTHIPQNALFINRKEELEELHALLQSRNNVAVVNGLGGVGKTALVTEYVNLFDDFYNHKIFIILRGDLKTSISTNTTLIDNLGLNIELGVISSNNHLDAIFDLIINRQ